MQELFTDYYFKSQEKIIVLRRQIKLYFKEIKMQKFLTTMLLSLAFVLTGCGDSATKWVTDVNVETANHLFLMDMEFLECGD